MMVFWNLFFLWLIYLFEFGGARRSCSCASFWVLLQQQWTNMTFCPLFKETCLILCYANAVFLDDLSLNKLRMLLGRGVWGQLGEGWIWLNRIIWNSQRTSKKRSLFFLPFFSVVFHHTWTWPRVPASPEITLWPLLDCGDTELFLWHSSCLGQQLTLFGSFYIFIFLSSS